MAFIKKFILLNFSINIDIENTDELRRIHMSIQKRVLRIQKSIKNPLAEKLKAKQANSIFSLKLRKISSNLISKVI